ncbi:biosynthetic-type acetolactate synthase large subunit [Geothrix fuzhouensis]|uniref:biosynthetic-type acetolactate synthase large subunit n=1 Tax=Geothrix fuzhouensis TaxID=2966451 RepID=UPI0021491E76|nr:biosynthetic-type acetolactate synthase large subunit [Geothrix fuzhouensis]
MTLTGTHTGAQLIWECLTREGVTTVFGYPGGAILPAYDAMVGFDIRHVLVRHEQSAVHMADGYARASGRVGVVVATSGPGATNLVTGLATAMMDSTPLVAITGQVGSGVLGTDAFQEVDITGITLPVTKHNYLVTRASDIVPALREAFAVAKSGRPGPVLVDITKDAQQGRADLDWEAAQPIRHLRHLPPPLDPTALDRALELIRHAKRPLILAGHGIQLSGARAEVLTLAERADIPFALTLLGLGAVPATHPLSLGMMGMHGEAWVNKAIQEADLLLALGMRFDDRVTGKLKEYALHAKKIHIDIDASELGKNVPVDVAIAGDLRSTLQALLPGVPVADRSAWLGKIREWRGDSAVRDIKNLPDDGHLYAAHVMHDLWRLTDGQAVVATDVGQHQMWEAQYYHHDAERSLITSGGAGTMGFALPAGIGAKIARPEAEVWVVAGDGGFQMTFAELMTAVQEGVKVNIAVINNGFLGMVRQWQAMFYEGRYAATPILSPDFVKLAEAFGIHGQRVDTRAALAEAVAAARAAAGTALIEFRVEQEDSVYPMVPAGAALHEMIRRPSASVIAETGSDPV